MLNGRNAWYKKKFRFHVRDHVQRDTKGIIFITLILS